MTGWPSNRLALVLRLLGALAALGGCWLVACGSVGVGLVAAGTGALVAALDWH